MWAPTGCLRRRLAGCRALARFRCSLAFLALPCRKRRRKEKGAEEEEDLEAGLELGGVGRGDTSPLCVGNGQDPDELGIMGATAADVPAWQMPKLVVECSRRPGARVHKGQALIMPEAGGDLMAGIVFNLPVLLQIRPCWHLGYSMAVDGVSLRTMYRQLADAGPCLLLVEDSNGCIFGAFLSEGLRPTNQCYGTHECFVFRYPRTAGAWRAEVFGQAAPPGDRAAAAAAAAAAAEPRAEAAGSGEDGEVDTTEQFEALKKCQELGIVASKSTGAVFCDHTGIVVGIDGPGLFIDQDLLRGVSWPSKAFGSPCLAAATPDFVVRNLEVWHWAG